MWDFNSIQYKRSPNSYKWLHNDLISVYSQSYLIKGFWFSLLCDDFLQFCYVHSCAVVLKLKIENKITNYKLHFEIVHLYNMYTRCCHMIKTNLKHWCIPYSSLIENLFQSVVIWKSGCDYIFFYICFLFIVHAGGMSPISINTWNLTWLGAGYRCVRGVECKSRVVIIKISIWHYKE